MQICPRCNKSVKVREKLVRKDGKSWMIESCASCEYNFEIHDWNRKLIYPDETPPDAPTKKPRRRNWLAGD